MDASEHQLANHCCRFPFPLCYEGSGIVVAVGSEVKNFKVGDAAYGSNVEKPIMRGPVPAMGSDYAVCEEHLLLPKPPNVSFEEAAFSASIVTGYQTIRRGLQLRGEESLEGKTVYVPAGLSNLGSIMIQMAKRIYGAKKIITTVSTAKLPLVEQHLPGLVDQVIDYKTQKLTDMVPRGSVDFMINTQFSTLAEAIPLVNPKAGTIVSVASIPPKSIATALIGADRFPWWFGVVLDLLQLYYKWLLRGTSIKYEFVSGSPDIREDLEKAGEYIAVGKVKPVVTVVEMEDMDAVRDGFNKVFTGKGGLGKMVIKIA